MKNVLMNGNSFTWKRAGETVRITAWGPNALRVQATKGTAIRDDLPGALLAPQPCGHVHIDEAEHLGVQITNGALSCQIDPWGQIRFVRSDTGAVVIEESHEVRGPMDTYPARYYHPTGPRTQRLRMEFSAQKEHIWGMGQQRHGLVDHKGAQIELMNTNGEFAIPFYVSSAGYGFLWNNPAVGDVTFAANRTLWTAQESDQIDYWIVVGDSYRDILCSYVKATGLPPVPPERMAGYWQCKLRYKTQDEVLEVARGFKQRNIPIDIIVIDFYHWTEMGDFKFDPRCFPDPDAMVAELRTMGIEPVVSVWPTVSQFSENIGRVEDERLMIRHRQGLSVQRHMVRKVADEHAVSVAKPREYLYVLDFTNPAAGEFAWEKVKANYVSHGIKHFWLDASEPSLKHYDFDHLDLHAGSGASVACIYPNRETEAFASRMREGGIDDGMLLTRCLWAGGQRYGAAVWSGDIISRFEELHRQITMSLHAAMSGLHLWHTDIGGFALKGMDPQGEEFRELLVRWFQWGVFSPVCRMHGTRPVNEPWSYGPEVEEILTSWIRLRRRLKPYILEQLRATSRTGLPLVRPLWIDHQDDPACLGIQDQYRFGDRYLVAPVSAYGARRRTVYLPAGHRWYDVWDGTMHEGGQAVEVDAPLGRIPVFSCDVKDGLIRTEKP